MVDTNTVSMLYGRGVLNVTVAPGVEPWIIRKPVAPKLIHPRDSVNQALTQAVGCPPLVDLARSRDSACIVVCDITRPVPNHLFLKPVIETMVSAGIALEHITILIATGLHRAGDSAEAAEILGDQWVLDHVRVEWHDARDPEGLVDIGLTPTRSTPVVLNRTFMNADLKIVTGLVEPHFMAGWSGGRKVLAPGVAGAMTIRTFHSARFMEDPAAVQCNLIGNPLHEEQLEIAKLAGELFAINTVIDEERDLTFVNFGEVVSSHLAAVDFAAQWMCVSVPRRFSTIVTSSAGYPLDKTYYQTVKGMVTPMDILEPGGTIIIVSECSEGLGSEAYRIAQTQMVELGPDQFLHGLLAKQLADIDEWQTEMQLKPMRVGQVQLYTTGLTHGQLAITGVETVESIEDAIMASIAQHDDSAVAFIPEGPYVVPQFLPQA